MMRLLSLLLLTTAVVAPVHANLTVHPMRTSVEVRKGAQIRVYSQSPQPQYVQLRLRRILDPAGEDEREVDVDPAEAAIAITPARFALAGGGNRLIRVVPLQPVEQEQAYRIYVEGVRGPEATPPQAGAPSAVQVGVSLVWGALVNVLPAAGQVQLHLHEGVLSNTGSLRIGVTTVAECDGARCTAHTVSRSLYPGGTMPLPFVPAEGRSLQLRYQLTGDGYREHLHTLPP